MEGQFWVLGKRRDLNCSALVVSSKMHPRFFPLKSSQDMALRYGKWGKSLPFRGDRACLQVTFNHSIAFDHSVAVRQSLLVGCYREHGSINTHKWHLAELLYCVACFGVGQRWFSILSFVYLCSGFFALVPVSLHLSSEYLKCHAALTSPCNQIHFRTLQKMLTFCPASFAQLRHCLYVHGHASLAVSSCPTPAKLRSLQDLCQLRAWQKGPERCFWFQQNFIQIWLIFCTQRLDDWLLSNAAETDETRLWRVNALHPRWIRNPWAVVQLWGLPKLSGCAFSMCRSCFGTLLPRMLEVSSHSCGCQLCWKGSTVDQWGCATLPCEPSPGWNVLWSDGQMFPAC